MFYEQLAIALGAFSAAALTALALTPLARRVALRLGAVDRPDGVRKLQKRPTALLGGVAVYLSLVVAAVLFVPSHAEAGSLLAAATSLGLLCVLGVCDDVLNLKAGQKFAAQVLVLLPIIFTGHAIHRIGIFGAEVDLGALGPVLSIFWLTACINALNLIDGVDSLASLSGSCIALAAAALAILGGDGQTSAAAMALCGALAGFLAYNRPPASIYLGDAGSMTIGAALGLLSMRAAQGTTGCTSLPPMLLMMAVPLGDTTLAIVRRWLSGKGIWQADRFHVHHRLLERGFSVVQLVCTVGGLCVLTGTIAVLTRQVNFDGFGLVVVVTLGVILVKTEIMGHHEWSLFKQALDSHLRPAPALPSLGQLTSMPFETAWTSLTTAAGQLSARRLELVVEEPGTRGCRHLWTAGSVNETASQMAVVDVRFRTVKGGWCHMLLEASSAAATAGPLWSALVGAVWQCTGHWAMNPSEVTVHGPRLFREETVESPQQRLAA